MAQLAPPALSSNETLLAIAPSLVVVICEVGTVIKGPV